MTRSACVLLLVACCPAQLASQTPRLPPEGRVAHPPPPVVESPQADPAPVPEPRDTILAGKPVDDRAAAGAVVGAISGAVLSVEKSECAPTGSVVRASIIGAAWGAIRAALRWDPSDDLPLPDGRDGGGQEPPFPFDERDCDRSG